MAKSRSARDPGAAEAAEPVRGLFDDYGHCLDDDRLEEWPEFFVEDASYRVIPRENLDRDPPFAIIYLENRNQLRDRVTVIRNALVYALRYSRHIVGNVRIRDSVDSQHHVVANYLVCTTDVIEGVTKVFSAGKYDAEVVFERGAAKFKRLDVIIDTYSVDRQMPIPL